MMDGQSRLAGRWIIGLACLAFVMRLALPRIPALGERLPRGYQRVLQIADTAQNLREGRGAVVDFARCQRWVGMWEASGKHSPPDPELVPASGEALLPYFDELGYLLLYKAIADVFGKFVWWPVLLFHALLSAAGVWVTARIARNLGASGTIQCVVAACYALNPLEWLISSWADHAVWPIYAALAAGLFVTSGWRGPLPRIVAGSGLLGAFLMWAVVCRGTAIAALGAACGGAVLLGWQHARRVLPGLLAGALLLWVGVRLVAPTVPSVGRSAVHHTLLAGLSEFGDIPGLSWDDAAIDRYLIDRYHVKPLTPEYDLAAKKEMGQILRADPWLPARVIAKRTIWFVVALRPGDRSLARNAVLVPLKLLGVFGFLLVWRHLRDRTDKRRFLALGSVFLANLAIHLLMVPIIIVYVAPFLIFFSIMAGIACLWLLWKSTLLLKRQPA